VEVDGPRIGKDGKTRRLPAPKEIEDDDYDPDDAERREKARKKKQKQRSRRKDKPAWAKETFTIETIDDLQPEELRESFMLRAVDAVSFGVYSGAVDEEVIEAARRVIRKWQELLQTLEAKYADRRAERST
jgi:hypothetical protein